MRKTLFDDYNHKRKVWSNIRNSYLQQNQAESHNVTLFNDPTEQRETSIEKIEDGGVSKSQDVGPKVFKQQLFNYRVKHLPEIQTSTVSNKFMLKGSTERINKKINEDLQEQLAGQSVAQPAVNNMITPTNYEPFKASKLSITASKDEGVSLSGRKNILPYLNKSDILYMRQQEKKIKSIKKQLLMQDRSKSPKRTSTIKGPSQEPTIEDDQAATKREEAQTVDHDSKDETKKRSVSNPSVKIRKIEQIKMSQNNMSLQRFAEYQKRNSKLNENWTYRQNYQDSQKQENNDIKHQTVTNQSKQLKEQKLLTKDDLKRYYDKLNDNLQRKLMDQKNYKMFYWAPDYSFCGFASTRQVEETAQKWMKDKRLKLTERKIGDNRENKNTGLVQNVSYIPQIMKYLKKTELD